MSIETEGSFSPQTAKTLEDRLRSSGWVAAGGQGGLYNRWRSAESGPSIVVPLDPSRPDFRELLVQAVTQFGSAVYQVSSPAAALEKLLSRQTDELLFRRDTGRASGRIAWGEGMNLYRGAETALTSAAKASLRRGRYFGRTGSHFANRFLQSCYMGQTQIGSYVVSAETPVSDVFFESEAATPRKSSNYFTGRSIVETLATALENTQEAATSYARNKSTLAFEDAVGSGVSSDMVKALILIVPSDAEADIEISWSGPARERRLDGVDATAAGSTTFHFDPDIRPALQVAAKQLENAPGPTRVVLRGWGSVINRPKPTEAGTVRLKVSQGTEAGTVTIPLGDSEFEVAAAAIARGAGLEVAGTLYRERSTYTLLRVTDVSMFALEDGEF